MKVSIVTINYNGKKDTIECIESLQKLKHKDFDLDIVVVDNASTDDSISELRHKFSSIMMLQNHENLGFSEGNNVGIKYSLQRNADFIWLLNNDTTVSDGSLELLIKYAGIEKKGGIFGPKIYFYPGFETHKASYKSSELGRVIWYAGGKMDWQNVLASHVGVDEVDSGQHDQLTKTDFVSGCSMFIRREVFETIGYLDPKFYLYYEDLDFCQRAKKKGYDIFYVPEATMWHKNAQGGGGTGSDLQGYFITRNRLLIGMRYAPWRTKLALFREATVLLMHGKKTQKEAIGDFLRKKYGKRSVDVWKMPQMPNLFKYFTKEKKKK